MILAIIIIFCIFSAFTIDSLRSGWLSSLISSFWVFTLFYLLSYPVKYIFITGYGIDYQAPTKPNSESLMLALILSFIFWMFIYVFRRRLRRVVNLTSSTIVINSESSANGYKRVFIYLVLICVAGISLASLYHLLEQGGFSISSAFVGNAQNEARVGAGHLFILYTMYLTSLYILLFMLPYKSHGLLITLSILCVMAGFLEMVLLGTRRPLFSIAYAFLLILFIRNRNYIYASLLAFFPIVSALMSPIGQVMRYSLSDLLSNNSNVMLDARFAMVSVGSTFEGIEHLANYLDRLSLAQLIFGVDQGIAWLFNAGLALLPRIIWETKPLLYGSVAEQRFIYPEMYINSPAQPTFPPGIVVDSMYAFGILFIPIAAYIYAKLFSVIDRVLFVKQPKFCLTLLMAAVIYTSLFNLVRGGTSILLTMVMTLAIALPIYFLNRITWK